MNKRSFLCLLLSALLLALPLSSLSACTSAQESQEEYTDPAFEPKYNVETDSEDIDPDDLYFNEPEPEPELEPEPEIIEPDEEEITVYVTDTGKKYHMDGCQYLAKSQHAISLEDAKRSYGPCSRCHPPR